MPGRTWGVPHVVGRVAAASARSVWARAVAITGGPPHAPQLALAGVQHHQPAQGESIGQVMKEVMGALWLAVPKKRVTPARVRQRRCPPARTLSLRRCARMP